MKLQIRTSFEKNGGYFHSIIGGKIENNTKFKKGGLVRTADKKILFFKKKDTTFLSDRSHAIKEVLNDIIPTYHTKNNLKDITKHC